MIVVRSALGAGRARLVRQMLVESLILGCTGGALGTLLAAWGLDAIVASFPEELPYWRSFQIDWRVASFIMALSVVSSIAFGLVPALWLSQADLTAALGSGRDPKAGRRALQLQGGLIVGQVAFSLALLVGAGLMYQSFLTVSAADPGFDQKPLLTMRIYLAGDAYDPTSAKTAFFRGVVERLRDVPGVSAATATSAIPSDDGGSAARVVTREHPVADGSELGVQVIGSIPGFFETMDVDLLSGRVFEDRDLGEEAPPVAIVNETLAIRLWPGQRAENQEIGLVRGAGIDWLRVIGVAPNIQYEEFGEETAQSEMNVFVPYSRIPYREMALLVRAEQDPAALAEPVRDALKSFAPGAPLFLVRTMEQVRFMTSWENRFFSRLFNLRDMPSSRSRLRPCARPRSFSRATCRHGVQRVSSRCGRCDKTELGYTGQSFRRSNQLVADASMLRLLLSVLGSRNTAPGGSMDPFHSPRSTSIATSAIDACARSRGTIR